MKHDYEKVFAFLRTQPTDAPLDIFGDNPYHTLVSTVMSARTNDDTTLVAATKLFNRAPTFTDLAKMSDEEIAKLIFPVGFYKTKARNIKKLAEIVSKELNGTVPNTMEGLVALPGVGRKTANLVLNRAFGKPAIAVDIHVHRITNMLRWVNTKTPEETEKALISTVPEKYWTEMNTLLVSLGRQNRSITKLKQILVDNDLISSQV